MADRRLDTDEGGVGIVGICSMHAYHLDYDHPDSESHMNPKTKVRQEVPRPVSLFRSF